MNAIELTNVRKNFGPTEIIRGVDLAIVEGEKHAIIGPNGAGKSTLYNLITARLDVSSGEIRLNDEAGRISGLSWAEGLVALDHNTENVEKGNTIKYIPF